MALVDVLVNVLDSLDGCNPLKIDVTAIFPDEVRAVRHYPVIVNLLSVRATAMGEHSGRTASRGSEVFSLLGISKLNTGLT